MYTPYNAKTLYVRVRVTLQSWDGTYYTIYAFSSPYPPVTLAQLTKILEQLHKITLENWICGV